MAFAALSERLCQTAKYAQQSLILNVCMLGKLLAKVLVMAAACSLYIAVMQARLDALCRYPNNARIEQLISLESILPNGQKKVPKVYQIACHPLQPHLVAVAANAGDC